MNHHAYGREAEEEHARRVHEREEEAHVQETPIMVQVAATSQPNGHVVQDFSASSINYRGDFLLALCGCSSCFSFTEVLSSTLMDRSMGAYLVPQYLEEEEEEREVEEEEEEHKKKKKKIINNKNSDEKLVVN